MDTVLEVGMPIVIKFSFVFLFYHPFPSSTFSVCIFFIDYCLYPIPPPPAITIAVLCHILTFHCLAYIKFRL